MPRPSASSVRARARTLAGARVAGALGAVIVGLVVAGCAPTTGTGPAVTPSSSMPSDSAGPGGPAGEPATEPTLAPDGTAADNLPLFAAVTARVWASDDRGAGRAYIDALVAAGFDKSAMEVTRDRSTVGNPAESIQFSVRWGDECLVGQVGPATGDPFTVIVPVLAEGTCLVGETQPIDW